MWEADSPVKGKISPYDDAIYIADAAIYLMATQPDLGITNPYSLDQTQFDAAIELLDQQKPLVAEYWADYAKQANGLPSGSIVAGPGLAADRQHRQRRRREGRRGQAVRRVRPAGRTPGWWPRTRRTSTAAYKWLDYIVSPEVNAEIAEYFGEAPANEKSCALTENKDHCDQFHAEEEDYWTNVYYWTTPDREVPRRPHRCAVRAVQGLGVGLDDVAFRPDDRERRGGAATSVSPHPPGPG